MPPLVFLPGAGGSASFWRPVADRLADLGQVHLFGFPGFRALPTDPGIKSLDDLLGWLVEPLPPGTSDVIAQSMGGVLAARLALERPERVARLVLVATSAGVDMARLGAAEWRHEYRALHPDRFLAARIPGARIVTVAGGTHSFASERAEEVASIIRSHLGQSNSNSN